MKRYDVYLVHASEDQAVATQIHDAVVARGLRVWFNSFQVGPSVRKQMENGLKSAEFGIVLVSPTLFSKHWARQELDSLFALESDGRTRILPIWFQVDAVHVRDQSPMLSMRHAASLNADRSNIDEVVQEIVNSIVELSSHISPASYLRSQILTGIRWVAGPELFSSSFALYDATFSDRFVLATLAHYGVGRQNGLEDVDFGDSTPRRLIDVVRAAPMHVGQMITVVGRQVPGSAHVLDVRVNGQHLTEQVSGWDPEIDLVSHCFQLDSVDFESDEMCYVHCTGPYHRQVHEWSPRAPSDDALCWVSGVLVASGSAPKVSGRVGQAIYIAAHTVMFTPPAEVLDD